MFSYQAPKSAFQRLLVNDRSGNFKIIIELNYTEKQNDDIEIQKQKRITINTTVNKARIISKAIDEQFSDNGKIDQYVFNLGDHKCQIKDIAYIFRALIEGIGNEISIAEDKKNILNQVLAILHNGNIKCDGDIELNIIQCKYSSDNQFDGIISYIKKSTNDLVNGNNDHLRLSGRPINSDYSLSNLLLYDDADIMKVYSNLKSNPLELSENDAFIEFDFVSRKINVTSYTIRASYFCPNYYHPKTWKLLGSNDHQNWELIDMKENNSELNETYICAHFECSQKGQYYRYIKYLQIDNWNRDNLKYNVVLSAIEFFGSIKPS